MLPSGAAVPGTGAVNDARLFASPSPAPFLSREPFPESRVKLSIAQLAEEQATEPGVTVTYISSFHEQVEGRESSRSFGHTARQMRRQLEVTGPAWERGSWRGDKWTPAKDDTIPDSVWRSHNQSDTGMRCGFSWDDAAAKANMQTCKTDADCVFRQCYEDLPDYQRSAQGDCISKNPYVMSDLHCQLTCGATDPAVCTENCECTMTSDAWDEGALIQPHEPEVNRTEMPDKDRELLTQAREEYDENPSGLPACTWRPGIGCGQSTQYECYDGPASAPGIRWNALGKEETTVACSRESWFGKDGCHRSCVHVSLLKPAPYYAIWNPGPEARALQPGERQPLYQHDPTRMTPELRGISMKNLDVTMSRICKSADHRFLAFTMYSPRYKEKALRLVRSCDRAGVCCKAVLLPSTAFGPGVTEDSMQFRFETIAMKPAFISEQMRLTDLPIVYLDSDLEFHRFPDLFLPGSWPHYERDVALFNYWGNETSPATKYTAHIGSGVMFFNNNDRARNLLRAWAQAMAYPPNIHAPDDQVLDLLYSEGGWSRRASYGWLPSSYMRTMPSYYRGVVPVIDHDHGSRPGLVKHSEVKPTLPPVEHWELILPNAEENEGKPLLVDPDTDAFAKEEAEAEAATAAARKQVAQAESAMATEAAKAKAEEAARQKDECKTWGIGSFQCPKKFCDPRETISNMDSLFRPEIYANPHTAQESDCREQCKSEEKKKWCVHYKFKPVRNGSCMLWDKPPDSCLGMLNKVHTLDKLHRRHQQLKRRKQGRQLHPFIQE